MSAPRLTNTNLYLQRLGFDAPPPPTLDTLRQLQLRHTAEQGFAGLGSRLCGAHAHGATQGADGENRQGGVVEFLRHDGYLRREPVKPLFVIALCGGRFHQRLFGRAEESDCSVWRVGQRCKLNRPDLRRLQELLTILVR